MDLLFLICAVGGGTVLVLQFLLLLIGIGGEDSDLSGDHDLGGDHDFGGDADVHVETDLAAHQIEHHGSTGFFKVLSLRAIVAALAFFGLGGMAAQSAGCELLTTLAVALACATAAVYVVYWLMRFVQSLNAEGTARIERTIGRFGTVYLRVPATESGSGKIQLNLQNRTMEYLAMTPGPELPTGTKVVVVGVMTPTTLAVERVDGPERNTTHE